jgi:hypothetical protein
MFFIYINLFFFNLFDIKSSLSIISLAINNDIKSIVNLHISFSSILKSIFSLNSIHISSLFISLDIELE